MGREPPNNYLAKNLRHRVSVFVLRKQTAWLGTSILLVIAAVAQAQPPARPTVVDLLLALTSTGVEVLYSSELVPATLEAPDSLPQGDPLARVIAALSANHLTLQSTGARSYIVTRATVSPAPAVPVPVPAASASRESTLGEISVFASRYEFTAGPPSEAIGFDQREFEQMPGATADPVRALRAAPGLATNLSARPYVRGAQLSDVLVEYDGIALADPFHFRDFQSILSVFNPATVNRADVFTGGFPAKYGTRSGGVIDLIPRSIESGSEYAISASLLSYDFATVGRSDNLPLDWLLVARVSSDDRVLQRLLSEEGEPEFYDVIGDIRWSVDSASTLTVGWLLLRDKITFGSGDPDEAANGGSRDFSGWLRWEWAPTDALKSHTSVAAADTERNNTGTLWLPGLAQGSLRTERSFSNIALRSDWTYASAAALWNFGGEFNYENADLMFVRQETLGAAIAASFTRPLNPSLSSELSPHAATLGLYSSAHRRWQAFEAEFGVRLDAQDYLGYGVRRQGSPRLNLRYDLAEHWHAYGSWGQFTQAQRIDEYRTEAGQTAPDSANRVQHSSVGITHDGADDRLETRGIQASLVLHQPLLRQCAGTAIHRSAVGAGSGIGRARRCRLHRHGDQCATLVGTWPQRMGQLQPFAGDGRRQRSRRAAQLGSRTRGQSGIQLDEARQFRLGSLWMAQRLAANAGGGNSVDSQPAGIFRTSVPATRRAGTIISALTCGCRGACPCHWENYRSGSTAQTSPTSKTTAASTWIQRIRPAACRHGRPWRGCRG